MDYVLLKDNNGRKKGDIITLDKNDFFTMYWLKKSIIKPYQQSQAQKVQEKQEIAVKKPKKSMKKGTKKK